MTNNPRIEHEMRRWPPSVADLCAKLRKGDTVAVSELEAIFGMHQSNPRFGIKLAQMSRTIKRYFETTHHVRVTIDYPKRGIHICTDEEAVAVSMNNYERDRRGMLEAHKDAAGIVLANLTNEQIREHESNLSRQAVMIGAMQGARRKLIDTKNAPLQLGDS